MKSLNLKNILLLLIFASQLSVAQKLTLNDLENICSKSNWESVNQFLMNKNWEYYESEKGNSNQYSTITWSYEKTYGDKASAWFYLYTYNGVPNKISYNAFNKPSYSIIQKSIKSKGYKLKDSEIEDNEIILTYTNRRFLLKITTKKREKEDYDESITSYKFLLIKKSSIYDPDNGKKTEYYDDTNAKSLEYIMLNGKMNGPIKVYYENGKLKRTGYYKNDLANGRFIEYNEQGEKIFDYNKVNGKKNGKLTSYENNKISYTMYYTDDVENGEKIEYYYDNETGNLNAKTISTLVDGEKDGIWKLVYINEKNEERILSKINYTKGLKNNFSQDIQGDSLIISNYSNNKLNGDYKIYIDLNKRLFGGVIKTDTTDLVLITKGSFYEDAKVGHWSYYDTSKTLRNEGDYKNNKKTNIWKNYYTNWSNKNDETLPYSKKLYLSENYEQGMLNGISTRYSHLKKEKYKCNQVDKNNTPIDSCTRMVYKKILEKSTYKNNILEGAYELRDSLNALVAEGNFKNDEKDGKWFHRYSSSDINNTPYNYYMEGNYKNNKKHGKWVLYYNKKHVSKTINFFEGELDGKLTEWNTDNTPKETKQFSKGKFKELVVYDSLGVNFKQKFSLFKEFNSHYKCRYTQYNKNGYTSQVYWVKKEEDIDHSYFKMFFLTELKNNNENFVHKDGKYLVYKNNKPQIIGDYYKNNKTGEWVYYAYSQNIKFEIKYNNGENSTEHYFTLNNNTLFSGEFNYIDKDNNTKEVRKIKDGLRNGNTTFIDLNTGKKIKKIKYKDGQIK